MTGKWKAHPTIDRWMRMAVGTLLMGIAYKSIYDGAQMVTGGFSGIGIIVRSLAGVPLWATNLVLNVPVFVVSYFVKGKEFVMNTLAATLLLTVFLAVLPAITLEGGNDYLLTAVFGGTIAGLGSGLVITAFATTGGTDMIAAVLQRLIHFYSIAQIMQVLDGMIVAAGAVLFGIHRSLYAVIAIIVTSYVSDKVVDGTRFAKAVYIISSNYQQIAQKVMSELERGVTILEARGMYSGDKKPVILCIVSKKQVALIKKIVKDTDENAFVLISDVREAMGEGFVKISQ